MGRTIHPYEYDWQYEGPDPYAEPEPKEDDAWFKPFHQAAHSGHVDGGASTPTSDTQETSQLA